MLIDTTIDADLEIFDDEIIREYATRTLGMIDKFEDEDGLGSSAIDTLREIKKESGGFGEWLLIIPQLRELIEGQAT